MVDGMVMEDNKLADAPIWNMPFPSIVSPTVNVTWVRKEQRKNVFEPIKITILGD